MRYTRKPKPIDAIKWDGTWAGLEAISKIFPNLETLTTGTYMPLDAPKSWRMRTNNGSKNVLPGHYVIKNEDGHFWTMNQKELDDYERAEDLDQVFPDSYNGRAKLYESISEKISNLERQKTIVVNEMRDLEHAWASAEEGKDYGCINSHEFDDPMLVKTGENHPHDDVELCPECGAEDIHKN